MDTNIVKAWTRRKRFNKPKAGRHAAQSRIHPGAHLVRYRPGYEGRHRCD
ncbi:hypothetical protein PBI_ASERPROCKY_78 [Gordonia phage ASerpRocky]|uniref:Uncharacterized protein n=1 Tax=Gordonia phage ASerpRocky TaxID=2599841 RepID=A0A5J6TDU8_9CAUD|nr:hypothetical protein PBI_ASERPROCKY_78 [Gordonia phage ASerpRocky]